MAEFAQEDEGPASSTVDMHVISLPECFVYKVPPLRSASGHRAEDWGLEHPLFTGCIKVYQNDEKLRILLYKYNDQSKLSMVDENLTPFGKLECPVVVKPGENVTNYVDGVIDSSRYFVLRIKDPRSERTTLIGIGFREKDGAIDLRGALNEYVRYIDRLHRANKRAGSVGSLGSSSGEETEDHGLPGVSPEAHPSLCLKEGEKIKVKIQLHRKSDTHAHHSPVSPPGDGFAGAAHPHGIPKQMLSLRVPPPQGAGSGGHVLPPPPHAAASSAPVAAAAPAAASEMDLIRPPSFSAGNAGEGVAAMPLGEEDEWGDFTDSTNA